MNYLEKRQQINAHKLCMQVGDFFFFLIAMLWTLIKILQSSYKSASEILSLKCRIWPETYFPQVHKMILTFIFLWEREQTEVGNSFLKLMAITFQDTGANRWWKLCSEFSYSEHIILWIESNQNLSCIIKISIFSDIINMGLSKWKDLKRPSIFHTLNCLLLYFI